MITIAFYAINIATLILGVNSPSNLPIFSRRTYKMSSENKTRTHTHARAYALEPPSPPPRSSMREVIIITAAIVRVLLLPLVIFIAIPSIFSVICGTSKKLTVPATLVFGVWTCSIASLGVVAFVISMIWSYLTVILLFVLAPRDSDAAIAKEIVDLCFYVTNIPTVLVNIGLAAAGIDELSKLGY